ncbi:MAG: amidase domain-containing protein [Candidatus Peribacteria bacterium]|jgi:hypothetical protein|nr:amidase domain-containing protein [Candidatus Peribacteria bacterium]
MERNLVTFLIVGFFVLFVCGCQDTNEVLGESAVSVSEENLLLWEKSQYDYSYLENAGDEANASLSNITLDEQDLQQLHQLANVLFGTYLTKLTLNWEERDLSIVDSQLFATESAREGFYWLLVRDLHDSPGYDQNILEDSPNIRILPHHIGERKEYLFLPIRVHGANQGRTLYDEDGNDDDTGSWLYYVAQLKRDDSSPYGWKIYYVSSWINRSIFGNVVNGPWTIMLNEDDDFSSSSRPVITTQERDYLNGKRDKILDITSNLPQGADLRSTLSSYDNHGAASYGYLYAFSYNSNYYTFSGNDCANFVSQCLYEGGGIPQTSTWYYGDASYPYCSSAWRGSNALYQYVKIT